MKDDLRNIGKKSSAWLRQVGIHDEASLRQLGPIETFLKVRRAGFKPSLNLVYALEGALTDVHWQQVPKERRAALVAEVEAAEAAAKDDAQAAAGGPVIDLVADGEALGARAPESFASDAHAAHPRYLETQARLAAEAKQRAEQEAAAGEPAATDKDPGEPDQLADRKQGSGSAADPDPAHG